MPWRPVLSVAAELKCLGLLRPSENCPDCKVEPGKPHRDGCDIERCSHCGAQALCCGDLSHDVLFARWTGFQPGYLEALGLGMVVQMGNYITADLNSFFSSGLYKQFFIKPTK